MVSTYIFQLAHGVESDSSPLCDLSSKCCEKESHWMGITLSCAITVTLKAPHSPVLPPLSFSDPLPHAVSVVFSWLVYTDPGFGGFVGVLEVGEYPCPETWGFPEPFIGSLRPLRMVQYMKRGYTVCLHETVILSVVLIWQMCVSSLQGAIRVEHPNELKVCSALHYTCCIDEYLLFSVKTKSYMLHLLTSP